MRLSLTLQAAVIRTLGKRAVRDVIEIGRRLTDAKAIPGHGGWLPWLDSEFGWTEMTATRYMNMHKLSLKSNTVLYLDLPMGALYLPAVPSTPAEVHDQAQQRSANGEDLSAADVQKMIDDARVKDAENVEAKRRACEIRLRAERKAGQLLQGMEKAKAGRSPQNPSTDATDFRGAPTLTDLGNFPRPILSARRLARRTFRDRARCGRQAHHCRNYQGRGTFAGPLRARVGGLGPF